MKSRNSISRRQFVSGVLSTAAVACLPKSVSAALVTPAAEALQAPQRPRFGAYRIPVLAEPFPMEQVRLLDSPFLDALKTNQEFLHSLPEDRLVHNFRVNAGITSTAEPLGGWEDPTCELRGHYTGHFLSSCGLMYAATGDDQLKAKGDAIVADLAACQQKFPNGYLSAFPQSFFDRLRDGLGVWAPFYTIHKIMAGMLDMYTYCHNEQALQVAQGMARWAGQWAGGLSDGEMERILQTEFGGMNESLLNLASITGNGGYFFTATRFEKMWFLKPLAAHRDELKGLHVNTHIPQVIGAARRYELTNDPFYQNVASYFWDEVTSERSYATGGTSNGERWLSDAGDMSKDLSLWSEECCCGYNMLKLTRHLHQWTADPRYMDYYERTLYNSRLGTQHPDNGFKMYYLPLATGYWKFFNSHFNSFWCCTGTGSEEFSKFNDTVYFRHGDDAFVNLFIPSEAHWPEKGLTLRQETHFPAEEGTTLSIKADHPVPAGINIRVPYWVDDGGSVSINGRQLSAFASPGSYLRIERTWADGDKIEVKLPMKLHAQPLLGDPTQQAALYGPLVLAGRLGSDGLTEQMQYDADKGTTQLSPPRARPEGAMEADVPSEDEVRSASWIEPVKGQSLMFQSVGQKSATTLVPLNSIFGERYGVYWKVNWPNFFRRG
jgi:uncharacterized protein